MTSKRFRLASSCTAGRKSGASEKEDTTMDGGDEAAQLARKIADSCIRAEFEDWKKGEITKENLHFTMLKFCGTASSDLINEVNEQLNGKDTDGQ